MINATIENFDAEVIDASMTVPVLVDFWAPWCGPCKSLGPVLEKLETAYAGRFKLVKIDSDQEQQISEAFGVRSIPTCVLLVGGQPVDGFTGALPEGKVREFLDKHIPPEGAPGGALDGADAQPAGLLAGDAAAGLAGNPSHEPQAPLLPPEPPTPAQQLAALQGAVAADPENDTTRFNWVRLLLQQGHVDDAVVAFAPVIAKASQSRQLGALQCWIDAINYVADNAVDPPAIARLSADIAANKRNFEARFALAQFYMAEQAWPDAMDALLEILMRDKTWADEKARKTYIAILELIEPPPVKVADGHIPPQDPLVATYRRRLSSVVLS